MNKRSLSICEEKVKWWYAGFKSSVLNKFILLWGKLLSQCVHNTWTSLIKDKCTDMMTEVHAGIVF